MSLEPEEEEEEEEEDKEEEEEEGEEVLRARAPFQKQAVGVRPRPILGGPRLPVAPLRGPPPPPPPSTAVGTGRVCSLGGTPVPGVAPKMVAAPGRTVPPAPASRC